MTLNIAEHRQNLSDANNDRMFSPALWANAPIEQVLSGITKGQYYEFIPRDFGPDLTDTEGGGGWLLSLTNSPLTLLGGTDGGHIRGSMVGADEDGFGIAGAIDIGSVYLNADDNATAGNKCWFEARWRKSSVADTEMQVFAGLAITGMSAALLTGDAMATKDAVGWVQEAGNGDQVDGTFGADTKVNVLATGTASVLAADTFVKTGFLFDPDADTAKRCTYYFNGVVVGYSTGAQTNGESWPDTVPMVPIFIAEVGSGAAAATADLAWMRCLYLN